MRTSSPLRSGYRLSSWMVMPGVRRSRAAASAHSAGVPCRRSFIKSSIGSRWSVLVEAEPVVRAAAFLVAGAAAERARPGLVAAVGDAAVAGRPEHAAEVDDDGLAAAGTQLPRRSRALGRGRLQRLDGGDLGGQHR